MNPILSNEIARLAPHLLKTVDELGIDPDQAIQDLIDEYGVTRKQAIVTVYRELGATLEQCARIADADLQAGRDRSGNSCAVTTHRMLNTVKGKGISNIFRRYHKQFGQHLVVDRSSIVSDLEVLKVKATKDKQYGPAVRATELQGRAAGVNFTEHVLIESDRLSDAVILDQIAGDDAELARRLKVRLGAIEGEWQEITEDNQEVTE